MIGLESAESRCNDNCSECACGPVPTRSSGETVSWADGRNVLQCSFTQFLYSAAIHGSLQNRNL